MFESSWQALFILTLSYFALMPVTGYVRVRLVKNVEVLTNQAKKAREMPLLFLITDLGIWLGIVVASAITGWHHGGPVVGFVLGAAMGALTAYFGLMLNGIGAGKAMEKYLHEVRIAQNRVFKKN